MNGVYSTMQRTSHPSPVVVAKPEKKRWSIFSFFRRVGSFPGDNAKGARNEPKDVVVSGVVEVDDGLVNEKKGK